MITRIEIGLTTPDTRAMSLVKRLKADGFSVDGAFVVDVYTIDKVYPEKDIRRIVSMLTDALTQKAGINKSLSPARFAWAMEIGFLPGVTDNVATSAKEMMEDLTHKSFAQDEGVYTSRVIYLSGKVSQIDAKHIADNQYNPLIQRATIKRFQTFVEEKGMGMTAPKVILPNIPTTDAVSLNVPDEALACIGKSGIVNADGSRRGPLALNLTYMKAIQAYFQKKGRNPTDIELESIAQTWSEHCKHTIFANPMDNSPKGLFRTYIKAATEKIRVSKGKKDFCVSVFTDNSGAIEFDADYLVTHKVETHNSPSALDPFGGSVTGIVGVNRDAIGFGLGAKPVINMYGFCVGNPNDMEVVYRDANRTQPMLLPRRILDGVVSGVNAGGNCSGIPTPQGFLYFDKRYTGKPLVFVGTVGLIPKTIHHKKAYEKKARSGDLIVMVGGRVGLDGIHGATFSSEGLTAGSPATAVQIGDPITQKKLSDAIVKEARDLGLYTSITDNGAGGLSCSVAEMAKESNGCQIFLEKVPLKYPGLAPWQIWISESQERMTLAVDPKKWKKLHSLLKRRGVESTVIGEFTKTGKCVVSYYGNIVMDVDMEFLHDGLPTMPLKSVVTKKKITIVKSSSHVNRTEEFLSMLASPNVASFRYISQQYDHEVQGGSVLKPLQGAGLVNGDASVTRPVLSSTRGVALSQSLYPQYSEIDPYGMAAVCIDTAIRNVVAVGGDVHRIALLDNFCWCSATDPTRLGQLVEAAKACYDMAIAYRTPYISGKDSMFNDFRGFDAKGNPITISIPPTLLISSISVIDDVTKVVSLDAKIPGDLVYLLGDTFNELDGTVPHVDANKNIKLYEALHGSMSDGLVASSQSVHRGGLAIALAKTAMGGLLGVDIHADDIPLFSESQGRILVTVDPKKRKAFEQSMGGVSCQHIGNVREDDVIDIAGISGKSIVHTTVARALNAYRSTFNDY